MAKRIGGKTPNRGGIAIFKAKSGPEIRVNIEKESVWLAQNQIAALFSVERSVITKHLRNILKEGELIQKTVCAKFAHTAADGKIYETQFYNLDMIILVGYRVNSKKATQFRIWATKILKDYLVKGCLRLGRQRDKIEGKITRWVDGIGNLSIIVI